MKILGIETSCDETAAAVVEDGHHILSNVVSSQIHKHAVYGGVVPELAAREHLRAIRPVVDCALTAANVQLADIDAVGVTYSPGLLPALLVGISFAKGLAAAHRRFPYRSRGFHRAAPDLHRTRYGGPRRRTGARCGCRRASV